MKVANLAMVLMTAASDAQASNGNEINRWCENDPAIALAYVDGIMDAYATVGPPIDYCPARDVTYGQVRDVVCKWVNIIQRRDIGQAPCWSSGIEQGLALRGLIPSTESWPTQSLIATNSSSMSATLAGKWRSKSRGQHRSEPLDQTWQSLGTLSLTPARRMQQLLRQRPVCFRQNPRLPRAGWRGIAGPLPKWEAVLAATAAASAALGITAWLQQTRLISDERPSLAVLPFNNLGVTRSGTVGLSEDIISGLSHPEVSSCRAHLFGASGHTAGPQRSARSLA